MALKKFNEISLQKTELLLKTYTGENIAPVGVLKKCWVQRPATIGSACRQGQPFCVEGEGLAIQDTCMLRLVCQHITVHFTSYANCQRSSGNHVRQIPEDKLGTFKSAEAQLTLKDNAQAHFHKAWAVPHALRPKVEEELRRLQNEGSERGTPIVPLPKKD